MSGITLETERFAAELREIFDGNPAGEATAWVRSAQRREAMVVALYSPNGIGARLPASADERSLITFVRRAILGIWAQEKGHTALIEGLRVIDGEALPDVATLMGVFEGKLTSWATQQGPLAPIARFLIQIGRKVHVAPDFTKEFQALTLRQFFELSHELELTACAGYERILQLLKRVNGDVPRYGPFSQWEFYRVQMEESLHAAVFALMGAWLQDDGENFIAKPVAEAALELERLRQDRLDWRRVPPELRWEPEDTGGFEATEEAMVISDAGLGELLADYGFEARVIEAPRN